MYLRKHATASPSATIAAYLTHDANYPKWRAHPATNPRAFQEAATMDEAVELVRQQFGSFARAMIAALNDAEHEFVVRRGGWSEDYGYYAGHAVGEGGRMQMRWQDRAHAQRMSVADAYAVVAAAPESALVEAWARKKKR